jgi:phosphomannomutase
MAIRFDTSSWRAAVAAGFTIAGTQTVGCFIGELSNDDKTFLGGEESAGLSIKGHYPQKDGVLACLLATEAAAIDGRRRACVNRLNGVKLNFADKL